MKTRIACLTLILLTATSATADDSENANQERQQRRPPPAAIEACAAAVQGDRCTFAGRNNEQVEGSCFAPADKPLACRPDNAPRRDLVEREAR